MIFFVTALALLVAWCGAVIYIRFRPSSPDAPLSAPPELAPGAPLAPAPAARGRLYHAITYTAPVVVGVLVVITFVILMVPVFHR